MEKREWRRGRRELAGWSEHVQEYRGLQKKNETAWAFSLTERRKVRRKKEKAMKESTASDESSVCLFVSVYVCVCVCLVCVFIFQYTCAYVCVCLCVVCVFFFL